MTHPAYMYQWSFIYCVWDSLNYLFVSFPLCTEPGVNSHRTLSGRIYILECILSFLLESGYLCSQWISIQKTWSGLELGQYDYSPAFSLLLIYSWFLLFIQTAYYFCWFPTYFVPRDSMLTILLSSLLTLVQTPVAGTLALLVIILIMWCAFW